MNEMNNPNGIQNNNQYNNMNNVNGMQYNGQYNNMNNVNGMPYNNQYNNMNGMNNVNGMQYNNQYNNMNYPPMEPKKSNVLLIALYILLGINVICCFLPLVNGIGEFTMNYVYYDGQVKDGVILIALAVLSAIFLIFKKKIPVAIFQILTTALIIYDFLEIYDIVSENNFYFSYGIGFYSIIICTIATLIISILRIFMKKKFN